MTWTAPEVSRIEAPTAADERSMLEGWLAFHRATLLHNCAGLRVDQLVMRSAAPSNLSLLGLVRHMTEIERDWFCVRFAGQNLTDLYYSDDHPDSDFDDVHSSNAQADYALFTREVERARSVAAQHSLEETYLDPRRGTLISLRWIYLHMIEEYARHNGHADLLRERIDHVTGV